MDSLVRSVKGYIKSILRRFGLLGYALDIRDYLDPKMRQYRKISRFTTTLKGISVQFSTEDRYSNSWFFPRYAGGLIHEKRVTEMLVGALQGAKCFVDVGANLGWYTCLASGHMPHGTVHSFEMDDLNYSLLIKNLAVNNCKNVKAHNMAVCDSRGTVTYSRENNHPSSDFCIKTDEIIGRSLKCVSVDSITLDDFLESNGIVPDVMKIDVEGAEMQVLNGARQTLKKYRPVLFLEIHPENLPGFHTSTSEILSLLIQNNYTVFEIESMRSQESESRLKPLQPDSIIEENTMVYATPGE